MAQLPQQAKAVIIGGGVIGCSVAYHLAHLGWTDVVLLERKQLTCGTTWHAAGLIGQLRSAHALTQLSKYSVELYGKLEDETGIATGYRQNGALSIALTDDRFEELRRQSDMASVFGVEANVVSPSECLSLFPHLNPDGVKGGVFMPKDGKADPSNIALALAKGARQKGARVFENVAVTGITQDMGRVTGVQTNEGVIACEYVVNCAGMWARDVGLMAGVNVPLHACEHFYIVTDAIPDLDRDTPTLRVPDECSYIKEDAGKFLVGAFEARAKPWGMDGIPDDFSFDQLPDDFDHLQPVLEMAARRVPALESAGIQTFFNGPESFTPDDMYHLGEAPELKNYFVAAGFNSIGIQSAGGAGMALAAWMDDGHAPLDLWDVDIKRMMAFQNDKSYLFERSKETLGLLYANHFPYRQFETARGVKCSALHKRLEAAGACFGELAGWERPNWFLPPDEQARGLVPAYEYSWKRQNWFAWAAEEHRAVREGVGLFDMSSFAKFIVEGEDAQDVLQRICANDVAVVPGRIVYTQWLNERGGIEADLTVTRLSQTRFLVVTAPASATRDFVWLKNNIPEGARCTLTDVTSSEAVIAIMGPKSRALLRTITSTNLNTAAFPFGTAQAMEIAGVQLRAHRITYVGELGWELYVPSSHAVAVYDAITAAGRSFDLALCGIHVLDSCRMEKAYRHFGHDIADRDHVLEAGLGFAVKTDKPPSRFGDFIGRDAVLRKKETGLTRRLLQFKLRDPEPLTYHNEPILRDGQTIGYLTSGSYGHTLGGAMGLGYVPCTADEKLADILKSNFEIVVAGERFEADASARPMYDPASARVRS